MCYMKQEAGSRGTHLQLLAKLMHASGSVEPGSCKVSVSALGFHSFLLQGQSLAQCNTFLGYEGLEKLSAALLADRAENEMLSSQIQHVTHLTPKLSERAFIFFSLAKEMS